MTTWVKQNVTLSNVVMLVVLLFQVASYFGGQRHMVEMVAKDVETTRQELARLDAAAARRDVIDEQLRSIDRRLTELKTALERHDELTRPR